MSLNRPRRARASHRATQRARAHSRENWHSTEIGRCPLVVVVTDLHTIENSEMSRFRYRYTFPKSDRNVWKSVTTSTKGQRARQRKGWRLVRASIYRSQDKCLFWNVYFRGLTVPGSYQVSVHIYSGKSFSSFLFLPNWPTVDFRVILFSALRRLRPCLGGLWRVNNSRNMNKLIAHLFIMFIYG